MNSIRPRLHGYAALLVALAVGCLAPCVLADDGASSDSGGQRFRARAAERRARMVDAQGAVEMQYGSDPLQKLDYWRAAAPNAPLVVFVHGGAWKSGDKRNAVSAEKIRHFLDRGYGFASLNYRLYPAVAVEDEVQDVAAALAFLVARAETLGFDARRVVLMGHSAGAHIAALIGTDPRHLRKAGLELTALRGVVLLDGAGYDVPRQMAGGSSLHGTYGEVFGGGRERQIALSPTHQAAAPNVAAFLILYVQRPDGIAQSQALAEALRQAGTAVEIHGYAGRGLAGHLEINRRLGDPSYPATPDVDEWLKQVFGESP
jgi:acetyl esterase/lipase